MLDLELRNRAKLDEVVGVPTTDAYLDVTEMISGRMNSFIVNGQVPVDGSYGLTAACVGTSAARVVVNQSTPSENLHNYTFDVDCGEPIKEIVDLRAGGFIVDVINSSPEQSIWGTGAFAAVRISADMP